MKNRILTAISVATLPVPWTILYIRSFEWALLSPTAEIMIATYAVFMIAAGVFATVAYAALGVRNALMKVCLVVDILYFFAGAAALFMMLPLAA